MAPDALRLAHGLRELFGQLERIELRLAEFDELDTERLQRVHFLFALGLADP